MFQFTRPQGARLSPVEYRADVKCFNSRARKGRDKPRPKPSLMMLCFNSRARKGRDLFRNQVRSNHGVSIHAPARGATGRAVAPPCCPSFNSRARKGRDVADAPTFGELLPFQFTRPQGARHADTIRRACPSLFQFTRPQGARQTPCWPKPARRCFNSRARKGRDFDKSQTSRKPRFQFTRPQGARPPLILDMSRPGGFQFTRPQGARRRRECLLGVRRRFNSRARKGRDAASSEVNCDMSSGFNSRARKGRDWRPPTCRASRRRFNSRARKGRDTSSTGSISTRTVSIHAPARGATRPRAPRFRRLSSFNSRARKGRDPRPLLIRISSTTFQFTRPQGARRPARRAALSAGFVSIHAPARGATSRRPRCPCRNPFQFTRPQGARRRNTNPFPATTRFNSRARKGRDPYSSTMTEFMHVSIHAPARGATPISSPCCRT